MVGAIVLDVAVTAPSQHRHSAVTAPSHCRRITVTLPPHYYHYLQTAERRGGRVGDGALLLGPVERVARDVHLPHEL